MEKNHGNPFYCDGSFSSLKRVLKFIFTDKFFVLRLAKIELCICSSRSSNRPSPDQKRYSKNSLSAILMLVRGLAALRAIAVHR